MRALEWAQQTGQEKICIRYDSQYAESMTRGKWRPKKNIKLITSARNILAQTEGTGTKVWWEHVKGHSGDKWNDRADELADQGAEDAALEEMIQGAEDKNEIGKPGQLKAGRGKAEETTRWAKAKEGGEVRWVTY